MLLIARLLKFLATVPRKSSRVSIKKEDVNTDKAQCSTDLDYLVEDHSPQPDSDDNYGDDDSKGRGESLSGDKDEDFVPPTRNSASSTSPKRRKIKGSSTRLRNTREIRTIRTINRKKRIKEQDILTLEEVIERRDKILESLPPFSRTMPKEDLQTRKNGMKNLRLSELCKRYRVKEFPCKNCNQVFTVYVLITLIMK